jgi:hypothetical protein
MSAFELLDLELAWMRLRHDHKNLCFGNYPNVFQLIEEDRQGWLNRIKEALPTYQGYRILIPRKTREQLPQDLLIPAGAEAFAA